MACFLRIQKYALSSSMKRKYVMKVYDNDETISEAIILNENQEMAERFEPASGESTKIMVRGSAN
jgi:hypothetical protein